MNILKNKDHLQNLLHFGDLINTVNGGASFTSFSIENRSKEIVVSLSNKSMPEHAFKFFVQQNLLILNVLHFDDRIDTQPKLAYPVFSNVITLPYYIDIARIEAFFEAGVYKIYLPFNHQIPKNPIPLKVKRLGE
ncbi:MAG: hypothetical protein ACFCUU_02730 [Cyclobacteriaceae bacterium]